MARWHCEHCEDLDPPFYFWWGSSLFDINYGELDKLCYEPIEDEL